MGACFQASHCHTQTMTNGNALCSLISFYIVAHHFDKILQGNVSTFMSQKNNNDMNYYSGN